MKRNPVTALRELGRVVKPVACFINNYGGYQILYQLLNGQGAGAHFGNTGPATIGWEENQKCFPSLKAAWAWVDAQKKVNPSRLKKGARAADEYGNVGVIEEVPREGSRGAHYWVMFPEGRAFMKRSEIRGVKPRKNNPESPRFMAWDDPRIEPEICAFIQAHARHRLDGGATPAVRNALAVAGVALHAKVGPGSPTGDAADRLWARVRAEVRRLVEEEDAQILAARSTGRKPRKNPFGT